MPELPEVESVCRLMARVLVGKEILAAEVPEDKIVGGGVDSSVFEQALVGQTVTGIGRKGKYWWIELDRKPWVFGHLGMSGWIRELGKATHRLHAHGKAPLDDPEGRPRFLKLLIETTDGDRIAFTDGRRLGRLWLGEGPAQDLRIQALGPDAFRELPPVAKFSALIQKRKAPVKGILLDQGFLSGIGNYLADEILYRAKVSPLRTGASLSDREAKAIHAAIRHVLKTAIEADAEKEKFPSSWLFHHRWGGDKGAEFIGGKKIVRQPVAGRTTAWVPEVQK